MRRSEHNRSIASTFRLIIGATLLVLSGCGEAPPAQSTEPRYASAEQVELNFHGQSFVLGQDNTTALVRPISWPDNRYLKLPFWLGVNILVPGVMQPKEGDYYVISEAYLATKLDAPNEWLIEAGSSLLKKDAVFVTNRTIYRTKGRILPTIVQYSGMRSFKKTGGTEAKIPVLVEVSLPMRWTLGGRVPKTYARFEVR